MADFKPDELLNETKACSKCKGGKLEINQSENKDACAECGGTGLIVDNRLAEILKKNLDLYIGRANRLQAMPKMLSDIYNLYTQKLKEAYAAGIKDGKNETIPTPDNGN